MVQFSEVGPIGFGLMGFTWRDKPCPSEQAFETMRAALKNGCTYWNGGEFYGPPSRNSLVLLEEYLSKYPDDADKFVLNIKGGMNPETHKPDGSAANTRRTLDDCIGQLKGRKKIDQFEFARRDQNADMGETFAVMKEYIDAGKLGGIALSEVRAETIHEAVKHIQPVAMEVELSLFCTDVLENGVAAACAQYGIPIIAYSPLGRGILTGKMKKYEDVPQDSFLKFSPRYQKDAFHLNLELVHKVEEVAARKGCTPAQFAINWVRALQKRPGMPKIIPIPGSTTVERLEENSKLVELTDSEMGEIDAILAQFTPAGARYPDYVPVNT